MTRCRSVSHMRWWENWWEIFPWEWLVKDCSWCKRISSISRIKVEFKFKLMFKNHFQIRRSKTLITYKRFWPSRWFFQEELLNFATALVIFSKSKRVPVGFLKTSSTNLPTSGCPLHLFSCKSNSSLDVLESKYLDVKSSCISQNLKSGLNEHFNKVSFKPRSVKWMIVN